MVVTKGKIAGQKDVLMDQTPQKAASLPQTHGSHSSTTPSQRLPATEKTEMRPDLTSSHSEIPSPAEPFPELDLEVGAEPNPSPTFAHEADMCISPTTLALPGPAIQKMRKPETGPLIQARVTWSEEQGSEEEHGEMREATARALEWAKKMFGKDAERAVEGREEREEGGHRNAE